VKNICYGLDGLALLSVCSLPGNGSAGIASVVASTVRRVRDKVSTVSFISPVYLSLGAAERFLCLALGSGNTLAANTL